MKTAMRTNVIPSVSHSPGSFVARVSDIMKYALCATSLFGQMHLWTITTACC